MGTLFKRFDVRELVAEGTEPYPEIRKRVDALEAGEGLLLISPCLPSPLIEMLCNEGFSLRVEAGADGSWATYFRR